MSFYYKFIFFLRDFNIKCGKLDHFNFDFVNFCNRYMMQVNFDIKANKTNQPTY